MAETVAIRTTGGAAISRTVISGTVISRTVICGTIISGTAMSGTAMGGTAISGTVISGTAISGTAVSGMAVRGSAICRTTIRGTATIRTFTTSVRPQKVSRATIVVMTGIHAGEVDGSKHDPAGVQGRGTPAVQRREGDGGDARHVGGVADDSCQAGCAALGGQGQNASSPRRPELRMPPGSKRPLAQIASHRFSDWDNLGIACRFRRDPSPRTVGQRRAQPAGGAGRLGAPLCGVAAARAGVASAPHALKVNRGAGRARGGGRSPPPPPPDSWRNAHGW